MYTNKSLIIFALATAWVCSLSAAMAVPLKSVGKVPLFEGHQDVLPAKREDDVDDYPKYQFNYGVKDPHTGDSKSQWEERDGDVVRGSYSVRQPDGTIRVVDYKVDDKSGFLADVKIYGDALHPEPLYYHGADERHHDGVALSNQNDRGEIVHSVPVVVQESKTVAHV